ncbi:MAG: asparagine synthase-related protein [Vicinamibacterales bacterium]|nr:asparagine synthase-related protein [Vicinamibacterales bacterium]
MSGLAAVFHRDGRPAAAPDLQPLLAAVRDRGPDREAMRLDGPAALGQTSRTSTPGSTQAAGPLHDAGAGLVLVFDGRLDDRPALASALGAPGDLDDAPLVLAAYRAWGEAAFARLAGDFALIIWDARRQRLVAARDILGLRPLCLAVTPHAVYCASSAPALARHLHRPIDEGTVAEALCGRTVSVTRTLYDGVERLPPGHRLIVGRDRTDVAPYWTPDAREELRYARDDEYADDLRTRLTAAVADRLRATEGRPAGLMLSGGLDSGSIYATAAALGHDLHAFTLGVADGALDETAAARATVAHVGGAHWTRVEASVAAFDFAAEAAATGALPAHPAGAASHGLRRRAAAAGAGVLLNGVGGDEWLFGTRAHLADLIAHGRARAFVRRWRAELAMPDSVGTRGVWRDALWPLVPQALRPVARRLVRPRRLPVWIAPDFARRVALADRLRLTVPAVQARSHAARYLVTEAWSPGAIAAREEQERFAVGAGLEDRAPFYDRRIVTFALGLPEEQRRGDGLPKAVLRRAMAGRLPASTLRSVTYGDYSHFLLEAFAGVGSRSLVADLAIARRDWVRASAVVRLHDALDTAVAGGLDNWPALADDLWAVLAVELWCRGAEGR